MNVISIEQHVDKNGIIINAVDLNEFINSNVRITIEKIILSNKQKKNFLSFAGSLNSKDAEAMDIYINECRYIEQGNWQ